MSDKQEIRPEGEELDAFLDELQKEHKVKEISGWDSGFPNLNRALDGILPGLYLLVGRPAIGKTSFGKQLIDQIVMRNSVPGIFFSFTESKKELRIKTLSRLSGIESREIRRGSAYLLHWYGAPKRSADAEDLPPSWEKVKKSAEAARTWLDRVYLIECSRETNMQQIREVFDHVSSAQRSNRAMVVIDDSQRMANHDQRANERLHAVSEQLRDFASNHNTAVVAVWPDVSEPKLPPHVWIDKAPSADVILVMESDAERMKKPSESNQAINLHIVKNRGGEKGKLAFDFFPSFSKFVEASNDR